MEEMNIWTITGGVTEGYQVHLKLNSTPTKMELETEAAVSVMSHQQWSRMLGGTRTLEVYQGKPLQGYAGHEVQVIGQVEVDVEYGHQKKRLPLILVAGNERPPLFGCSWMQGIQLDWAKQNQVREKVIASNVSQFPAIFSAEVGKIQG